MARKDLLKGLMGPDVEADTTPDREPPAPPNAPRVDPARPRYATGAIGAVSGSIAALKSRAVVDLDPHHIEAGGLADRLEHDEADHKRLMQSLKIYGQQVPILVRPHPERADRYQIVYGRRRVLAMRDLGLPIKAMIRELDDEALVMAQGQENSARRDLSFVEKCCFARQMADAGYDRKAICDALNVDKTLISRMLSVTDRVPIALIETIGAAHGIGRDRWLQFATLFAESGYEAEELASYIPALARSESSDDRFVAAYDRLVASPGKAPPKRSTSRGRTTKVSSSDGLEIAKAVHRPEAVTLTLLREGNGGFEDWLVNNLAEIHRDWVRGLDDR